MEVIVIEARTFEAMREQFEAFADRIDMLAEQNGEKSLHNWMDDNQDVCQILNITKRTLQTYRDNGIIPYTQIGHKIYYKSEDVERIIKNLEVYSKVCCFKSLCISQIDCIFAK